MSDSEDSGPDLVECNDFRRGAKLIYEKDSPFVALQPPEVIYERWNKVPASVKRQAAQLMNVCSFWYYIVLLRQECHTTTRWAVQVGFIDSNASSDLSLKRLQKIDILEAILRAMEKGCMRDDQTRHMIWISNKFNLHAADVLEEALLWLERTGEPRIRQRVQELGNRGILYSALQKVFSEYAHYTQAMGVDRKKMMRELCHGPSQWAVEKSEEMKYRGNDQFQKKKYDCAVKSYSKAIKYHPENHIIYGNRALCYIRCEKYLKAVGDGKRAILIKPMWAKGHYRFCEALFYLGEHRRALDGNLLAQGLCKDDAEGMRDLQQQYLKFTIEMEDSSAEKKCPAKKPPSKRPGSADSSEGRAQAGKPAGKSDPPPSAPQNKGSGPQTESARPAGKNEGESRSAANTGAPTKKSETTYKKSSDPQPGPTEKQKGKNGSKPVKGNESKPVKEKPAPCTSKESERRALRSAVQDAHVALSDQRSRNAEQAFSQALSILTSNTPKDLGVSSLDQVLLLYGRASALVEIGQPEELAEAEREFEKIKSYEERKFQCLVYFGIGKVFLKWNRFPTALAQFSDSLQMVKNQITPGKLTWPMTKDIVKETQPEYFKGLLQKSIEMCKFPPRPDAICRHRNCVGHSKIEIFFTDPDFKGFIHLVCCQNCIVEYHISCWKTLKASVFSDRSEKDFLQEMCFTPDCAGRICTIKIYGSTGLIKCKFEAPITKPKGPVKVKINQKCTSLKKLKSKEERKLRRRQHKQASSKNPDDQTDQIASERSDHAVVESQEKAPSPTWLLLGDRVLLQISESRELFLFPEAAAGPSVAALLRVLEPWVELDRLKGGGWPAGAGPGAGRPPQTLGEVVELLLQRRNRVWARVFVQSLSGMDAGPKLHDWAVQLDRAGLSAAGVFIERYAEHLEQLDLAPLLLFPPLQDLLVERFGAAPQFFSVGLSVTEYLKQAPPHEARLLIWTLEEYRDQFASCHGFLDEYFEMMDGLCVVIRKSENENPDNSPIKTKNRNRRKKQREPKNVIYMGHRSTREEDEEDFLDDDDSLLFLEPSDPFSVPNRLRERVAEFEGQYNNNHSIHYKRVLDNNPDPTKESLYDYFAQILEKHGPLGSQDPLLVGQLVNFPPEARQKIQECGGLQPFLLESLRFVLTGDLIGLMRHAVALNGLDVLGDDNADKSRPHPLPPGLVPPAANHFPPPSSGSSNSSQDLGLDDLTVGGGKETPAAPVRREPVFFPGCQPWYPPGFAPPGAPPPQLSAPPFGAAGDAAARATPDSDQYLNVEDLDLRVTEADQNGVWETTVSTGPRKGLSRETSVKTSTVQVACDSQRERQWSNVLVNTEPYEPFEANYGDMTRREKDNAEFMKQIHHIQVDHDAVRLKRREASAALEAELRSVNVNIEITNRELALFQQKLEEEVKKDQQEKRQNQETLKALKVQIKELTESQESLTKTIKEKNMEYQTLLNDFLELSNQSAAQKMSLEDEIKRCKDLCSKSALRTQAAELSILETLRGRGLRGLYRCQADARAVLAKLKEVAPRFPTQVLYSAMEAWDSCAQEADGKIQAVQAEYQQQLEQVRRGARLSTLPPIVVPDPPQVPPQVPSIPIQICDAPRLDWLLLHPPSLPASPAPSSSSSSVLRPPPGLAPPLPGAGPIRVAFLRPEQFRYPPQMLPPPPHQQLSRFPPPHPSYGGPVAVRGPMYVHPGPPPPPRGPVTRSPAPDEQPPGRAGTPPNRAGALGGPHAYSQGPPGQNQHQHQNQNQAQHQAQAQASQLNQSPRHQPNNVFEKILDRLSTMFPHYRRPLLMTFIGEVRAASGGTLNSHSYEDVINRVAQRILDHQDKEPVTGGKVAPLRCGTPPRSDSPASARSTGTPPPAHVWKSAAHGRPSSAALNMEDPCIICHDEMCQEDVCVLECRHSFHRECIKSWLREQSTCPTCREHALLPEDFPMLPGRLRRGHAPTAFSS